MWGLSVVRRHQLCDVSSGAMSAVVWRRHLCDTSSGAASAVVWRHQRCDAIKTDSLDSRVREGGGLSVLWCDVAQPERINSPSKFHWFSRFSQSSREEGEALRKFN